MYPKDRGIRTYEVGKVEMPSLSLHPGLMLDCWPAASAYREAEGRSTCLCAGRLLSLLCLVSGFKHVVVLCFSFPGAMKMKQWDENVPPGDCLRHL